MRYWLLKVRDSLSVKTLKLENTYLQINKWLETFENNSIGKRDLQPCKKMQKILKNLNRQYSQSVVTWLKQTRFPFSVDILLFILHFPNKNLPDFSLHVWLPKFLIHPYSQSCKEPKNFKKVKWAFSWPQLIYEIHRQERESSDSEREWRKSDSIS